MVLLGTENLTSAYSVNGPEGGLRIEAISLKPWNTFFKLCLACQLKIMASIPPSAFSAGRIRQTQQNSDMKLSKTTKANESQKYFNTSPKELSPLKYNSKLMNSIWGIYNRYSPHNVKNVNDANTYPKAGDVQPSSANTNNKSEPMITLPSAKLDNVWAAIKVSQSN